MTRTVQRMARGDLHVELPSWGGELGGLVEALGQLRGRTLLDLASVAHEHEKLRTTLATMIEGVALLENGHFIVANPAFSQLLGIDDVIGRTPLEAVRTPGLDETLREARANRQVAEQEMHVGGRVLQVRAQPLGGEQAVCILIDMTESRRIERLRRDFVANASHELRTPVAAIVGAAETLAAGAAEDPQARSTFVAILRRHADRLSVLTADLLDLARLEAGYRPRRQRVRLTDVIDTVRTTLGARAREKNIELRSMVAPVLAVSAERAAVEQMLTNLVENAIKYTAKGGRITLRASARDTAVELVVEDTGCGIAAEHLPRLFERFYRADDARSRELGGTGLGLSIVKHLVIAHQGNITVESKLGRGTRFVIQLPIS